MSGFLFVRSQSGSEVCGTLESYTVPASETARIAIGDVVRLDGDSDNNGIPQIKPISDPLESAQILGVVHSFDFNPDNLLTTSPLGSTLRTARIATDPLLLYEVDADTTLAGDKVGLNAAINNTGTTTSGNLAFSAQTLNTASAANTVVFPLQIVALLEDDEGVLGGRVLVRMNNQHTQSGVSGV